ncbi:amidase [Gimesia aquarii]|uniref:Glutamyl-tRNA(Gln) amidotransferase subunit A n=1 Tax=Gimesia aquarii TaxID=2527964 RepID=A0A517X1Z4_9PLAN|nr:amidase [Gimesia aquarii]QDU11525.1 Glutamyl-tRNA(Gln) amidotransferase subunit A [Gimesia aquarii]
MSRITDQLDPPDHDSKNGDNAQFWETNGFFNRRQFLSITAAVTACTPAACLTDQQTKGQPKQPSNESQNLLPNSMAPAIQFQASPYGSAAYLERLSHNKKNNFSHKEEIKVEPWKGSVPESDEEIAFLPVHRLAALIQSRQLSPVKLTEIYLERIKQLDPQLLCAVTIMEKSAIREAKQAEQDIASGQYRGPLHGIPWGVKDLFSTRNARTTWGAKPFENRMIDEDAEIVTRLRKAGAILIAKLSTGTFAQGDQWYRGRTRNPWNTEEGSSGSSAGPGSATAAGCVAFAIGTETRGSIVSPSKRCGINALRPTFGRVSRHGCMTLSWTMDKVGPMCRTIEDCALVFNAIHGADEKDPSTLTAPFRFQRLPDLAALKIGYREGTDEAFLTTLRRLGANLIQVPAPPNYREVKHILTVESATAFDDFISQNLDEQMVRKVRVKNFRPARNITALDYLNAQRHRFALMQKMADYFENIDLYITHSGDTGLTNLTGHPAAVFPYQFDKQPRCITLIGNLFTDDIILSVAHAYQTATSWHLEHPQIL